MKCNGTKSCRNGGNRRSRLLRQCWATSRQVSTVPAVPLSADCSTSFRNTDTFTKRLGYGSPTHQTFQPEINRHACIWRAIEIVGKRVGTVTSSTIGGSACLCHPNRELTSRKRIRSVTFLLWSTPFCSNSESISVGLFVLDLTGEKPNGRAKIGRMEFRAFEKQFMMPEASEGMIRVLAGAERNSNAAIWESYEQHWQIGGDER